MSSCECATGVALCGRGNRVSNTVGCDRLGGLCYEMGACLCVFMCLSLVKVLRGP